MQARWWTAAMALALSAACGDGGARSPDRVDVPRDAELAAPDAESLPTPDAGSTEESVSLAIMPGQGALLELPNGATLEVPPDALDAPATIALVRGAEALPGGYRPYSPVYRVEPSELAFAAPVRITVPVDGDPELAAWFVEKPRSAGTTGFDWHGGSVSGARLSARIVRGGRGFSADGAHFAEVPDLRCLSTQLLEGRRRSTNGVVLSFRAEDCWGRAATGLACGRYPEDCAFELGEDGAPLSAAAAATVVPGAGALPFVSLVLDVSASAAALRGELVDGAKRLVDLLLVERGLAARVSVGVFDRLGYAEWQAASPDAELLRARLDALSGYEAHEPEGADLFGALVEGLRALRADEGAYREADPVNGFAQGYLVLFSAAGDTAGRVARDVARAAIGAGPEQVLAVGLAAPGAEGPEALAALAPHALLRVDAAGELAKAFAAASARIASHAAGAYRLGYCSTATAGAHSVSVALAGATPRAAARYAFEVESPGAADACPAALFDRAAE